MFNSKPYMDVNREERFFCFLLAHSVLSSSVFRSGFVDLIRDKLKLRLNADAIEPFVEAAALRDYFDDLGDYAKDETETGRKGREVLVHSRSFKGEGRCVDGWSKSMTILQRISSTRTFNPDASCDSRFLLFRIVEA